MDSQAYAKTITIIGYVLFIVALLSIILMTFNDYTSELIKLEKVRQAYQTEYCDTLTADIYKCTEWDEQKK